MIEPFSDIPFAEYPYPQDFAYCPEAFWQGFWLRNIVNINSEVNLHKHNYHEKTKTVSASFILLRHEIEIFNPQLPGIILLPRERIIPWWYDGRYGHKISNMMSFDNNGVPIRDEYNRPFDGMKGVYRNISETEIFFRANMASEFNARISSTKVPLNEAKLRYHLTEIDGFYINLTKQKFIREFFELRRKLSLLDSQLATKPLYSYHKGRLHHINQLKPPLLLSKL